MVPAPVQSPGRFQTWALQEAQQLGILEGSLHTPSTRLPLLSCPLASWSYRAGGPEAAPKAVTCPSSHTPMAGRLCLEDEDQGAGLPHQPQDQIRWLFPFQSLAQTEDNLRTLTEIPKILWNLSQVPTCRGT